jgi:hypothetical protein
VCLLLSQIHVGLVVEKMALRKVLLSVVLFSSVLFRKSCSAGQRSTLLSIESVHVLIAGRV